MRARRVDQPLQNLGQERIRHGAEEEGGAGQVAPVGHGDKGGAAHKNPRLEEGAETTSVQVAQTKGKSVFREPYWIDLSELGIREIREAWEARE